MTAAKTIRFAAVLVVLVGYAFIVRPGEARIAAQSVVNARTAERLAAAERTIGRRRAIERERDRLAAGLHARAAAHGDLVARFLHDAGAIASARRCAVVALIASTPRIRVPGAPPPRPSDEAGDGVALDATVEGRYADVLATAAGLSRSPVLAGVEIASVARKNADAADPAVSALLKVTLHRIAVQTPESTIDARARPR